MTTPPDLESLLGALADTIPEDAETKTVFSRRNLPRSPAELATRDVVITKGTHGYHSYTISMVDELHVHAGRRAYRLLALLFLTKVFHATPKSIRLHLIHPESQVRSLVLDYAQGEGFDGVAGYQKIPGRWTYWPGESASRSRAPDSTLPLFCLTDERWLIGPGDRGAERRDVLRGAGSDFGNIRFAETLLDFARQANPFNERALESPYGTHELGLGSAELRLWLPGSIGWYSEWGEEPS